VVSRRRPHHEVYSVVIHLGREYIGTAEDKFHFNEVLGVVTDLKFVKVTPAVLVAWHWRILAYRREIASSPLNQLALRSSQAQPNTTESAYGRISVLKELFAPSLDLSASWLMAQRSNLAGYPGISVLQHP
jgi:hypothetical protein